MGAFIPLLVLCAGLYAYHDSLQGPFIFDDVPAISANPTIRQLWSLTSLLSPPPGLVGRPVVSLSLAINYALGGLDVWGYHAFNLAIHLAAALALYGVVRRTLLGPGLRDRYGDEAPWLALAVTLIWVVHPLQTESVTYTIQRTELLMGLFLLLTLYCVIRGAESAHPGGWYAGAVVSSALGMGSKEVMAVAPVVVLAYDRLFLSPSFSEAFRRRVGLYAGLAGSWLIFAALVQTRMGRDVARLGFTEVTRWDYAKTQAGVIAHYLRLALWPAPLVGDYDDWPLARSIVTILPPAALVSALLGATLWAFHRRLRPAFLGVWFFLILAPTSSIWPLLSEFAAERRMYLPLAAVVVLVVLGAHLALAESCRRLGWPAGRRRFLETAVLVAIVAALAQASVRRNEAYRSVGSFWSDVVAKRPNNARGHNNLGEYLLRQGRNDEALSHFSEAVRLKPTYEDARNNLGAMLAGQGKLAEAIAQYSEVLRLNPAHAGAHTNLGSALARQGKVEEAAAHYSEAFRIAPDSALAHYNLGLLRANQGNLGEAILQYSEALRIDPSYAEAHTSLGNALASQGKIDEAIAQYSEALRVHPNDALVLNNLGAALSTQGKLDEAIARYSEAIRINPNYADAQNNLGSSLARQGKFEEAISHFAAALRINPEFAAARNNLSIALARQGKPKGSTTP